MYKRVMLLVASVAVLLLVWGQHRAGADSTSEDPILVEAEPGGTHTVDPVKDEEDEDAKAAKRAHRASKEYWFELFSEKADTETIVFMGTPGAPLGDVLGKHTHTRAFVVETPLKGVISRQDSVVVVQPGYKGGPVPDLSVFWKSGRRYVLVLRPWPRPNALNAYEVVSEYADDSITYVRGVAHGDPSDEAVFFTDNGGRAALQDFDVFVGGL